jgi:hypothetical protein
MSDRANALAEEAEELINRWYVASDVSFHPVSLQFELQLNSTTSIDGAARASVSVQQPSPNGS